MFYNKTVTSTRYKYFRIYFANSIHVIHFDTLQISLKQSTNIIGPKTDPYGTPQVTLNSFKTHRSMFMIYLEWMDIYVWICLIIRYFTRMRIIKFNVWISIPRSRGQWHVYIYKKNNCLFLLSPAVYISCIDFIIAGDIDYYSFVDFFLQYAT